MYYVTRERFVSIEPIVAVPAAITLVCILIINLILLVKLNSRRNDSKAIDTAAVERISERLGLLEGISNGVTSMTRLFTVPYARGGLGETMLADLLKAWLPRKAYELQYRFGNGTKADAVVRIGGYIVAIDSKFPLEQVRSILDPRDESDGPPEFNPGVKRTFIRHIEAIAGKYVQPAEGSLEFALMYIPSEALYYRAFVDGDGSLMAEALKRRVVPTGPSGLFLYLQTVSFGLQGFGLAANERRAAELIRQLVLDFSDVSRSLETTSTHVRNANKNISDLNDLARRFQGTLERLSSIDDT